MNFEWIIKQQADTTKIRKLSQELNNLHPALSNLLIHKNISTFDDAKNFFRPTISNLHDPFLMKNMDTAVNRLKKALINNENILIYGDYDVDGTTSVALIYNFLSEINKSSGQIAYYIPDRYSEGYGISKQGIDFADKNNFSLVIALDCGIKAIDKIDYANKKNIDFIICDHHTPAETIPNAVAILNPKQKDCKYPYKELSGCGVGFKFIQAFAKDENIAQETIFNHLDLVAISTAADIVPMTGENRILEFFGLQKLQKTTKPGLIALKEIAGKTNSPYSVSDVVFKLGPRINAAGRMQHAKLAVELLTEKNTNNAKQLAIKLNSFNQERKINQDKIYNEIVENINQNPQLLKKKSIVAYNRNWSKGVVGIVASKIVEKFYKPTIILTKSNEKWTGSARSINNFNLYDAINKCNNLLDSFGGHKFAAGLTIKQKKLDQFIDLFEENVKSSITKEIENPKIEITNIINFAELSENFVNILSQFAPFGPQNMRPIFLTTNVVDTGLSKKIGKTGEHLRLEIKDTTGKKMNAIAFGFGKLYNEISRKKPFNICYNIEYNLFNGQKNIQLNIKDIKI